MKRTMDRFNGVRGVSTAAIVACFSLSAMGCGQQQAVADKEKSETLASGTVIVAALQNTIDTGKNKVGDSVTLRTLEDVLVNQYTVVPAGSTINGEVTHIDPAGRVAGGAELTIRYVGLEMPDGKSYPISATPLRMQGKGDAKESAAEIGGGALVGGLIGGLAGGSGSVAKGAAAGAVVGTGVAVATKGDQIVLPAGQKIKVSLDAPVTVVVKAAPAS